MKIRFLCNYHSTAVMSTALTEIVLNIIGRNKPTIFVYDFINGHGELVTYYLSFTSRVSFDRHFPPHWGWKPTNTLTSYEVYCRIDDQPISCAAHGPYSLHDLANVIFGNVTISPSTYLPGTEIFEAARERWLVRAFRRHSFFARVTKPQPRSRCRLDASARIQGARITH
jgi:hypothetical protein